MTLRAERDLFSASNSPGAGTEAARVCCSQALFQGVTHEQLHVMHAMYAAALMSAQARVAKDEKLAAAAAYN